MEVAAVEFENMIYTQPAYRRTNRPTDQRTKQPTSRPTDKPTSRPPNHSTNRPPTHPPNQPTTTDRPANTDSVIQIFNSKDSKIRYDRDFELAPSHPYTIRA
jgi:hypothetical protein